MLSNLAARFDRFFSARPARKAARRGHSLEILEARIAPAALLSSIVRAAATPDTSANTAAWTVTFNEAVTGVDPGDFLVHIEGNAHANTAVTVSGGGATYTVTATGLHGQGDVRLDLVDNDTITGASGVLGGVGVGNGSFAGAAYHLLQTFPKVNSIAAVGSTTSSASSVSWTVTLSAAVTGVDAADFVLVQGTGVTANAAVTVTPVSSTVYTVTATHVSGGGTLGLKLVDDGTIKDANLNPLQGATPPVFAPQTTFGTGNNPRSVVVADLNGDGRPDLVTASGSNSVNVLLGNGNGGFAAQTTFGTGNIPFYVAVADVNGDGKPDLVTANYRSSNVSVLLGNGSGGFAAQTTFATGAARNPWRWRT